MMNLLTLNIIFQIQNIKYIGNTIKITRHSSIPSKTLFKIYDMVELELHETIKRTNRKRSN